MEKSTTQGAKWWKSGRGKTLLVFRQERKKNRIIRKLPRSQDRQNQLRSWLQKSGESRRIILEYIESSGPAHGDGKHKGGGNWLDPKKPQETALGRKLASLRRSEAKLAWCFLDVPQVGERTERKKALAKFSTGQTWKRGRVHIKPGGKKKLIQEESGKGTA